jgi:hypothetical protein
MLLVIVMNRVNHLPIAAVISFSAVLTGKFAWIRALVALKEPIVTSAQLLLTNLVRRVLRQKEVRIVEEENLPLRATWT